MPTTTINYLLEAFLDGDGYIAICDKRRFLTIDNQFHRVAELVGDGVTSGWEITPGTFPEITVTAGSGLIDGFCVNTFGDYIKTLSPGSLYHVYAQRRVGVIGVSGPKSNVVSVTYTDSTPPAVPSDLQAQVVNYEDVQLSWSINHEVDFSYYSISRSTDNVNFVELDTTTDRQYLDETTEEEVTYYYRVSSVDLSGNPSTPATTSIHVPLSLQPPPDPVEVTFYESDWAINLVWKHPPGMDPLKRLGYRISWWELDSSAVVIASSGASYVASPEALQARLDDLLNGRGYKITIQTIDSKNRTSPGISRNVIPQPSQAPKDPKNISAVQREGEDGVEVDLSWQPNNDEYDPAIPKRYRIYVTVDGQPESLPIDVPISETSEQISLYTFDYRDYLPIPEGTLVTFRITSLDAANNESVGNFLRFETETYSPPTRLTNPNLTFDPLTRNLIATWGIHDDTEDVQIEVFWDKIDDEYVGYQESLDRRLGKAEKFVLASASPNTTYDVRLTPYNKKGQPGPETSIVTVTPNISEIPKPLPPNGLQAVPGDRQILLTWLPSTSKTVSQYRVYRRVASNPYLFSSYQLMDTLPKETTRFWNYGLQNGTKQTYYVTSVDIYGRESLHLADGHKNVVFAAATPQQSGILTEPDTFQALLSGNDIYLSWSSLPEEFDGFTVYRSKTDLHHWEAIGSVPKDTFQFIDLNMPMINGTTWYYTVDKFVNDAEIIIQTTGTAPENSICLGEVELTLSDFRTPDVDCRRDIGQMVDPIAEFTDTMILDHRHLERLRFDPSRIRLDPDLIVNDWTTKDGITWKTTENIEGSRYLLRVNDRFPNILYTVQSELKQIIFTEVLPDWRHASIELKVLGVEEVQGTLEDQRILDMHARQVAFGRINRSQLPTLNHDGRIREPLYPERFLLERYSDHTFVVPQFNQDSRKNFGNGTAFYAVTEGDGDIDEIIDFDQHDDDAIVGFQKPSYALDTLENLILLEATDVAGVSSDPPGFQSEKCYHFSFQFVDDNPYRWVRLTSENSTNKPNPVIDLRKRIRFRIKISGGSLYFNLGVREIEDDTAIVGDDGGTTGPVEWVGIQEVLVDETRATPRGVLLQPGDDWQEIDIDLTKATVRDYLNGDGKLTARKGVLEHFAFAINPDDGTGPYEIYIDKLEQVNDLLVSATSQGILTSDDFGTSWSLSRLTDTPTHKFYRAEANKYMWAISSTQAFVSSDPTHWFALDGLTGVQNIRDICEDDDGNVYVSTDKGVYFYNVALINRFGIFVQTKIINPFTNQAYSLYSHKVSSGLTEIWVSTETGIFKTTDQGRTWQDTGMDTGGFPCYKMFNIGTLENPILLGITRRHVVRKMPAESNFRVIADLNEQLLIDDIWTCGYLAGQLYVACGSGVYTNATAGLSSNSIVSFDFIRVFDILDEKNRVGPIFCLDTIKNMNGDYRLAIGQENRLWITNDAGQPMIRCIFGNKEIPSFYVDDVEINAGYTYNVFNGVVAFREPLSVASVVSACYLPRRSWLAKEGGWAQANSGAEVFIYKNGVPTWLDFALDETSLTGEVQLISNALSALPPLTTFNSLYPKSQQELVLLKRSITNLLSEKTSANVRDFLAHYTRFVSLITPELAQSTGLGDPEVNLIGINKSSRSATSRASQFETKDDFLAADSTGIVIDACSGRIDFTSAWSTATSLDRKQELSFDKFDHMEVTIFNAYLAGTGEYTHPELEDQMESLNSGMPTHFGRSATANLIKLGTYLESQHNYLMDQYVASPIQSRFYSGWTTGWYDVVNSTIDYREILSVDPGTESRVCLSTCLFTEDPYLANHFWLGTDRHIQEYAYADGDVRLTRTIAIDAQTPSVNYLYVRSEDEIYAVTTNPDTNESKIFTTSNFGYSWSQLGSINLPSQVFSFCIVNGVKVAGTSAGIFYCDNQYDTWYQASLSNGETNTTAKNAFVGPTFNLGGSTFIIMESDLNFYTSQSGFSFFAPSGRLTNNDVTAVNKILRFMDTTWVATDKGLYSDSNSIVSSGVAFKLESTLEESSLASAAVAVTDVIAGSKAMYCCGSNGTIYRFYDENEEDDTGNEWKRYPVPDFGPIQRIILIEGADTQHLIAVSYEKIKLIDVTPLTGVFG